MTEILTRRAGPLDARPMAELLNEIIAEGGTTALTEPVARETLLGWMEADPRSIWHVAEDAAGEILGFQWIEPHREHGETVGQIATFARRGRTGLGIGSKLFEATKEAARAAGYAWINAEIRADNAGGLAYYQSRGFEDYGRIDGYMMADGMVVDKVLKRYDL
ncbi:GNAT family N-acetyltransferase [Salipiger mucosus]|uniref:Acetyltransferase, GNAT family protein n=1 Tax=Salipiger mucosus DSM 16094 TaxID=1123237 RepID=S9S8B9_9RHOB|nr:GNAT family N-acetyltransferase [Salipiger mucosus]EPX82494.1 acetyltransferase, GNAT family protein [Salipiger mucosus DSM 16094]